VLRLGYSRPVEFLPRGSLSIPEGDVYVVSPSAPPFPHCVPEATPMLVRETMKKENPTFKPVEGHFVSAALVCRTVPIRNKYSYNGDEIVFADFNCWSDLINAKPIKQEQPVFGIPTILTPNIHQHIRDTTSDFYYVPVPAGHKWDGRLQLSNSRAHTPQNLKISFIEDCVISVLFGSQDILFGARRIFTVTKKQNVIKFLKTLFFGSEIRVIVNLNTCSTSLDVERTIGEKKPCWLNGRLVHEPLIPKKKSEKGEK